MNTPKLPSPRKRLEFALSHIQQARLHFQAANVLDTLSASTLTRINVALDNVLQPIRLALKELPEDAV